MTNNNTTCGFEPLSPLEAKRMLDSGKAILIDIRAPDEYSREHIIGARLAPLDAIDARDFEREQADGKVAIFQCQSGRRTALNRERLIALGFSSSFVIEGRLNAWRSAGLPIHLADPSAQQAPAS